MTLEVRPLSPAIGAIINGIDLGKPLTDRAQVTLRDSFYAHSVLLVRGQNLTSDDLVPATSWLGPLSKRNRPDELRKEDNPYISKVSNIRVNGELIGSLPDGEMFFHFDAAYVEKPQRATFLYAVEVPSSGGNTLFANMYTAYDLVPPRLKLRLGDCTALQVYDYRTVGRPDSNIDLTKVKHYSHPIFLTHPVTQRKALYVSRLMTARINDMDEDESAAFLDELFAYAEDPSIRYEHVWRPGDFMG